MTVYAVTYSRNARPGSIVPGKRYEVIEEDGPRLFRIRSETGRIISCLWDGCAFLRGDTWTRIEAEEQVTLRAGDYVSTAGMTEDQYHAVARAFMAAGAKEFGSGNKHHEWSHVVWHSEGASWARVSVHNAAATSPPPKSSVR